VKPREIHSHISNRRAHGGVVGIGHAVASGMSLAKRVIPFAPEFTIDRDGTVWLGHSRVPTTSVKSPKGVDCLAVRLNEESTRPVSVWRILSQVWYENKLILPRDGNAMSWIADNVVVVPGVSGSAEIPGIRDPDEILLVIVKYFREDVGCWQMAEKSGLVFYSRDQFASLIRDVLSAGIR